MPRSSRSSCGTCRRFPFAADDTLDQSPEKPPLPSARAEVCLRTSSHAVSTLKMVVLMAVETHEFLRIVHPRVQDSPATHSFTRKRPSSVIGEKCGLAARGRSLMVRAHGSCEAETRREEELMLFHHDDEQQSIRPQPPCARRVTAASHHLRCCRASTMYQHRSRRGA